MLEIVKERTPPEKEYVDIAEFVFAEDSKNTITLFPVTDPAVNVIA